MSDSTITEFSKGEHGIDYARESVHVDNPDTILAVQNALQGLPEQRDYLVSIHGWPKRGSKGDKSFRPGDHRVYSTYVTGKTLHTLIQRGVPSGPLVQRPERERFRTEEGYQYALDAFRKAFLANTQSILDFANIVQKQWQWNRVDGLTIAVINPVEE